MIDLHEVSHEFAMGSGRVQALRDISLTIPSGSMVAICGPSGSGKSTLLNVMGCLLKPQHGRIEIMGKPTIALSDREQSILRRRHLGFIFQSFNLIPVLSAFENVEYPLLIDRIPSHERRSRVAQMLDCVGMLAHASRRPNQLSGGQCQRVAIARALVARPQIVLADEPTANLDSHTASEILKLMSSLNKNTGTAFIFSTHDPMVSSFASIAVQIQDGALLH
jgi:putative ABC transport system ATP-binding protein